MIEKIGTWMLKKLPTRLSLAARGEGKKMDKAAAIAEIMRVADEHGINYIFFESNEDAVRLLADMRYGFEARKVLGDLGIKMAEPRLM